MVMRTTRRGLGEGVVVVGHVGASSRLRDTGRHCCEWVAPVGASSPARMPFCCGCASREECFDGDAVPCAGYFSLLGQREGNQEKGRPSAAPFGFPALLARGGGSPTGRPWPDVEQRAVHGPHPFGA